ncbi:MAG TPA: hypothetical protein VKD08_12795 [Ignavibacteriaceae bacterium]|nr:hypothetical protein [Ignavibacteriaceae bacterium]
MNRKLKSTLGLVALLIFILVVGGVYILVFQRGDLKDRRTKVEEMKAHSYNTADLKSQYQDMQARASVLDSVLAARKFNIPKDLSSIKFYDFVNDLSDSYSPQTTIDIEYADQKPDKNFFVHEYKLSGGGAYNDVWRLIYAIEQSKELKKIKSVSLSNLIKTDEEGMPHFMVNFNLGVDAYYSNDSRFATSAMVENNLTARPLYDAFYPLIRNEIPPNLDNLLDVQGAKLLALVPEGAFIGDSKGNTYLLWEGEQVYLGYLTKIDYERNSISFILNKGGIIEKVDLGLEKEDNKKDKKGK